MKKQLKHISVHQSSKVIALIYLLIGLIICIPMATIIFFAGHKSQALGFLLIPFAYFIASYILTAIFFWFYNRIANVFGGIEFTTENVENIEKVNKVNNVEIK